VAWAYHTGGLEPKTDLNEKAAFEATPILVEGLLSLSTPFNQVIALDPGSGMAKWTYDPRLDRSFDYSEVTSRGVAAWSNLRIFEGTIDARLIGLDGKTGARCGDFGTDGTLDLTRGMVYGPDFRGSYQVTSPPTIVGDFVIIGSSIADNGAVDMPRGTVRGYDARSGALRWSWNPIPWAENQRSGQPMVELRRRSGAGSGIHPHRECKPGLLRRRASGR
jgi:quinoprotein glucose dehydrogenase